MVLFYGCPGKLIRHYNTMVKREDLNSVTTEFDFQLHNLLALSKALGASEPPFTTFTVGLAKSTPFQGYCEDRGLARCLAHAKA